MRELQRRADAPAIEEETAAAPEPASAPAGWRALQRRAVEQELGDPATVTARAEAGLGGGGAIPFREQMEAGFGVDFGGVRAHTDGRAAAASRSIGAAAYTMGDDVVFGAAPTPALVAHELAHVVQQKAGAAPEGGVGRAGDAFEVEADQAAAAVEAGRRSDLATRYARAGGGAALQRKAVQRYETGEHAILGDVSGTYPAAGGATVTLPCGAVLYQCELVALGDFYAGMEQLLRAPRQEVEALAGICRLEAVWVHAQRARANAAVTGDVARWDLEDTAEQPIAPRVLEGSRPENDSHGPLGSMLDHLPHHVPDDVWGSVKIGGSSLGALRAAIHAQFTPSWSLFGISLAEGPSRPETGMAMLRATVGRRRFRGDNNPNRREDSGEEYNSPYQDSIDPGHLGGDYLDLAQHNVSHFSPNNWANWRAMHHDAIEAFKVAKDEPGRDLALATDMMGGHFLTDRFSTGHFVHKEELMVYATQLMLGQAQDGKGDNPHEKLKSLLHDSLAACFEDQRVRDQWMAGVEAAATQGVIGASEAALLRGLPWHELLGLDTGQGVVDKLTDVIMGMPWRELRPGDAPDSDADARSTGPLSVKQEQGDPAKNQYHLGLGNLAALQVHDALNTIGFTVRNGAGQLWRLQGDHQVNDQTIGIASEAIARSQAAVRSGSLDETGIQELMPCEGWIAAEWIDEFFAGKWGAAGFDLTTANPRVDAVKEAARGRFPIAVEGGNQSVSPEIATLCKRLMDALFLPPTTGEAAAAQGGLNIDMLKEFLIRRLEEMVPYAYMATSAADLPQAALELYAPRDGDGMIRPRAAHDFTWSGDQLTFRLDVTGCKPGPMTLSAHVFDRDAGYDQDARGQKYGRGNADPSAGVPSAAAAAENEGTLTLDDPEVEELLPIAIDVPACEGWDSGQPPASTIVKTVTIPTALLRDDGDRYVSIGADEAGLCIIGRSREARDGSQHRGNPTPQSHLPVATGAVADPAVGVTPAVVDGGVFHWDGNSVMFSVRLSGAAAADGWVDLFVTSRDGFSERPADHAERISVPVTAGQATTGVVTYTPPVPDHSKVSIEVYRDPACTLRIGKSSPWMIGGQFEPVDDGALPTARRDRAEAEVISTPIWDGQLLRFDVTPSSAERVYVKFFDKDWDYDHDAEGNLLGGGDTDEQLGGVYPVELIRGHGQIAADADADAYAVIYADPGCTRPRRRSSKRP